MIENERGYVFDKNDPGGETKFGISKKSYPHQGWSLDPMYFWIDPAGRANNGSSIMLAAKVFTRLAQQSISKNYFIKGEKNG